jgi:sodium-dependent dicarboxylate transporter 2/3/5
MDSVIFLFMGGFMLGLAIEKWNLHRRIALGIVKITGTSGNRIILGFILATGFISMWISNTATTMMMFPIALSVIHVIKEGGGEGNHKHFNLSLMLAIAYASNFGGISTIVGTPPNVAFVGYFEKTYKTNIEFLNWMLLCTPIALLLMISLYFILTRVLFRNRIRSNEAAKKFINEEYSKLGRISIPEIRVLIIFVFTAMLWIFKDPLNNFLPVKLDDSMIALIGAVALFVFPAGKLNHLDNLNETDEHEFHGSLLEWADTKRMAWGILLLFGGGLALAAGLDKEGLIKNLGDWLSQFAAGGGIMLLLMVTIISLFVSEVMSNIAQVIVFSPVVCSLADAVGMNPLILGIAMTLAASCASMMPMGTPPNAIAFASGHIKIKEMMKAGVVMNIVSIILITLFCWFLLPILMKL